MDGQSYYPSLHKDSSVAFWLVAYVHQLDTHALWSAKAFTRRDSEQTETTAWLFREYFCDSAVLHEFIKRGLVARVEKQVTKHIVEKAWQELEETISACRPFISFPPNEEAIE
jgi:hypothetical protein